MRYSIVVVFSFVAIIGCSRREQMAGITLSSESTKLADAHVFVDILGKSMKASHSGKPVDLIAYRLPDMSLPSGRVVASDGFIMDRDPFTRQVKPLSYPMLLAVAKFDNDERVAFALIQFSQSPVEKWETAVTESQDLSKLESDQIYGYGVDSGTGCFCDADAKQIFNDATDPDMRFFSRVTREMDKSYKPTRAWIHISTAKGSAALFSSGFGDGLYASYFGLDEDGNPVALLTDFGIVDWPRRP